MAEDWDKDWRDFGEAEIDFGRETEDYVENMLIRENTIAIAELTNRLPSRITHHPWLLQVRDTAIRYIVHIGGPFALRKITVYTAAIYVDRFLSVMKIQNERFEVAKLLAVACLSLASERHDDEPESSDYEYFNRCSARSIMNMKNHVKKQFGGILSFVTPIQFIKYFLSKFCKDLERKETAKVKALQVIMSTIGDFRLMSLRAFIVGAAATLLASNPNILTEQMIQNEINALPQNWIIPLDEVCSCYNRLLETNWHRLDIN